MAATNDFLAFATGGDANVESQAAWAQDPTVANGFYGGIAPSAKFNKAWRQAGFPGAAISEWVLQTLVNTNVPDDGNVQEYVNNFQAALTQLIQGMTRLRLTQNTNLYVSTSGNDANPGTQTLPFATPQGAWNYIMQRLDLGGHAVYVNFAHGTYPGLNAAGAPVGQQQWQCVFQGDPANPTAVVLSGVNEAAVSCAIGGVVALQYMRLQSVGTGAGAGCGIYCNTGGLMSINAVDFGTCTVAHLVSEGTAAVSAQGYAYTISAGAPIHASVAFGATMDLYGTEITIYNNPNFPSAFVSASTGATVYIANNIFNGTATGPRYSCSSNGIIILNGANGNSYLPGNANGVNSGGLLA